MAPVGPIPQNEFIGSSTDEDFDDALAPLRLPVSEPQVLNVGTVFTIPIDDDRVGIGQAVAAFGQHAYYLAVYDWAEA